MNSHKAFATIIVLLAFVTQLVMLSLQVGAFRRHRHVSFQLLAIATSCGILYVVGDLAFNFAFQKQFASSTFLYVMSAFLVVQMILGVWGTASLFNSYRHLSEVVAGKTSPDKTSNNRMERSREQ